MSPLVLGALFVVLLGAYVATKRKSSVAATEGGPSVEATQQSIAARKQERFGLISRLMGGWSGTAKIERNLVTAGLMLKPSEFVAANLLFLVIMLAVCLLYLRSWPAAAGIFFIIKQLTVLAICAFLGWRGPQILLQFMADKRRITLETQLADALAIISSGLKGGYSFVQGLSMASEQLPEPLSLEFARVIRLIQLGVDTSRALEQMSERVNSYDYDMTVSATNIQLSSGGNLSTLLERIAQTIRDRISLRRDIAALTAQGRMSGAILIALPIGIAIMLRVINREYFDLLLTTGLGNILLYLAAGQQAIGIYWIKKLLDFDN